MANEKISQMPLISTFASGDLFPIVDISEASAADRNKSVTFGELFRNVLGGSASDPSIAFTGDQNTGIYSPGADQVAVATNGVGRLFVNSNGDIGLGTSSPDVFGRFYTRAIGLSSSGSTSLQINSATGSTAIIDLGVNSSRTGGITSNVSQTSFSTLGATPLILETNSSERLRITSAGLVGIGTSAPATKTQIQHADATASVFRLSRDGDNATTFDIDYNSSSGHVTLGPTLSGSATAFNLGFKVAGSTRMQIDGSGRVGIGTTSPSNALHVVGTALFNTAQSFIANSATGSVGTFQHNGTSIGDIGSGNQTLSGGSTGDVALTSRAGALVFGINTVEKARIDTSGRLLVGTSSARSNIDGGNTPQIQFEGVGYPGATFSITRNSTDSGGPGFYFAKTRSGSIGGIAAAQSGDTLGQIIWTGSDGTNTIKAASIDSYVDGTPGTNDMPGRLVFSTTADGASSPTERVRITSDGSTHVFNGGVGIRSISSAGAGTSVTIFRGSYSGTGNGFAETGTESIYIWSNGNVQNANNSYTAISDIKLKENIVDANSQWGDVKALRVRNYNLKEGQTHRQIGLIAQEVELISPGLVYESPDHDAEGNDLGTVTKSVNYSVLYMKAVKALQEAMERIETLEGMVAVNNITIDEQQHQLSTLAARLTALENA
jgi:hypothetical protein